MLIILSKDNYIRDKHQIQPLIDTKKGGKENVDWQGKKLKSLDLFDSYKRLYMFNKASRVYSCGSMLEFRRYKDNSLKLNQANFCKVRLCPLCAWRRSLKIFGQLSQVMDNLDLKHYDFIFLTLTSKNVYGEDLKEEITSLMYSFNKLTKRSAYKKAILGHFRGLEVTHNIKNDTYHPHFHVVLVVPKSYFKKSDKYITQNQWVELWQSCLKVDYKPIVDIRKFKAKNNKTISTAVAEAVKYTVKSSDYIIKDDIGQVNEKMTDKAVITLDSALANRRLIAFGGIMQDVYNYLNLDDPEQGDLINTDNEEIREDLDYIIEHYHWNIGYKQYIRV